MIGLRCLLDAATGSTISGWSVPHRDQQPCIALLPHGKFILMAHAGKNAITFWDPLTRAQLSSIQHTHDIRSIVVSSDGESLAIADERKIIVKDLSSVISCLVSVRWCPVFIPSVFICLPTARTLYRHANEVNSRMRKYYYPQQSRHRIISIMYSLVGLLFGHGWDTGTQHSSMQKRYILLHSRIHDADTVLNQVHRNSAISRRLHCNVCDSR